MKPILKKHRAKTADLHRLSSDHIIKIMEQAGFTLEAQSYVLRNKADQHTKIVWDKSIRRKTDRAILKFRKV